MRKTRRASGWHDEAGQIGHDQGPNHCQFDQGNTQDGGKNTRGEDFGRYRGQEKVQYCGKGDARQWQENERRAAGSTADASENSQYRYNPLLYFYWFLYTFILTNNFITKIIIFFAFY